MGRRTAALVTLGILLLALEPGIAPPPQAADSVPKFVVIGIDGMDWTLTEKMIAAGELPHLARLAAEGMGQPLGTSLPPLSPVAWSDFITGMDAGGHGIFDFIHRHPDTLAPYLSTSEPRQTGLATHLSFLPHSVPIGKYCFSLIGEEQVLLRHGQPFWEPLERAGIETTIIRIPANFPVTGTATHELSGMGTPDLLGTYGTFTFYTTDVFTERKSVGGGQVVPMDLWDDIARGKLYGPPDPTLCDAPETTVDFQVDLDSEEPVAMLEVGDERRVLQVGEWSDWVRVSFPLAGPGSVAGIVRFYLRQLRPEVELYASPINIDPLDPAQAISTPDDYAAQLAEATGLFYTQGMPEDTKARSEGYFSRDEFLEQTHLTAGENIAQFHHVLDQYRDGLLFYYFGHIDQTSHMMWGTMDPTHPGYVAERDAPYADVIPALYRQADEIIGYAMEHLGDDVTLVVMSDHGFDSWKRTFHLNAWLAENGYLAARNPGSTKDPGGLFNVDWSRTRAYGVGFNGLYINLQGREKNGIVAPQDERALIEELQNRLQQVVDPKTGELAIPKVYVAEDYYTSRGHLDVGPDLLMGYAEGTRVHSNSAIGQVTGDPVFSDNTDDWSGDHQSYPETVPGILFVNRQLGEPARNLRELSAAILAEMGVTDFPAADRDDPTP